MILGLLVLAMLTSVITFQGAGKFKLAFIGLILFSSFSLSGQLKLGGDPASIDDGSILELESTNQAFVPTRLTSEQRDNIPTPLTGAIIFNLTESCVQVNLGPPEDPFWDCLIDNSWLNMMGVDTTCNGGCADGAQGPQGIQGCLLYTSPSPRD